MTPRALDWRSIRPKLRKIDGLLDTLRGFGALDGDRLRAEEPTALATERILTLIVELAFAVNSHVAVARLQRAPDSYAESFALAVKAGLIDADLAARLSPSAAMRNVLVHMYLEVDYDRVADAVPLTLEWYGEYVRQVAAWMREHETRD